MQEKDLAQISDEEENIQDDHKSKNERRKTRFYYSFLTVVLLFCFLQIGGSVLKNVSKIIMDKSKIITLNKTLEAAQEQYQSLNKEISFFSNIQNLEGIGRNNFKMAGENEVVVVILPKQTVSKKVKKIEGDEKCLEKKKKF